MIPQPNDYPNIQYSYDDPSRHYYVKEDCNYAGPYPSKKVMLREFQSYCKKIQDENHIS